MRNMNPQPEFGSNAEAGPSRPQTPNSRQQMSSERMPKNTAAVNSTTSNPFNPATSHSNQHVNDPTHGPIANGGPLSPICASTDPQGLQWYIADLSAHVADSWAALKGYDNDNLRHYFYSLLESRHYDTVWTPEDKGRFFAALSRHSRLRPDLIAVDVGTKTEAQVALFLKLLQFESSKCAVQKGGGDESDAWISHPLWSGVYEVDEELQDKESVLAQKVLEMTTAATRFPIASSHQPPANLQQPIGNSRDLTAISQDPTAQLESWGQHLNIDDLNALQCVLDVKVLNYATVQHMNRSITNAHREINALQSIPLQRRSEAQKVRLRRLRKTSLVRIYRQQRLLHQVGVTQQQLGAGGGLDSIFMSYKNRRDSHRTRFIASRVDKFKTLGARKYLSKQKWNVLNPARIAVLLEASGPLYDRLQAAEIDHGSREEGAAESGPATEGIQATSTSEPAANTSLTATSLEFVSCLHSELLAYLRPLVYTTILVAEGELGERDGVVEPKHVLSALGLRDQLAKLSERVENSSAAVSSSTKSGWDKWSRNVMSLSDASTFRLPHNNEGSDTDMDVDTDGNNDDDTDGDDVCGVQTDEEDGILDKALDDVDGRLDAVMSDQIVTALSDDHTTTMINEDLAYPVGQRPARNRWDVYTVSDRRFLAELEKAQDEYITKAKKIYADRRLRQLSRAYSNVARHVRGRKSAIKAMEPHRRHRHVKVEEPESDNNKNKKKGKLDAQWEEPTINDEQKSNDEEVIKVHNHAEQDSDDNDKSTIRSDFDHAQNGELDDDEIHNAESNTTDDENEVHWRRSREDTPIEDVAWRRLEDNPVTPSRPVEQRQWSTGSSAPSSAGEDGSEDSVLFPGSDAESDAHAFFTHNHAASSPWSRANSVDRVPDSEGDWDQEQ